MPIIIDANYILRWFLNDFPQQATIVDKLLQTSQPESIILDRVTIAEITYVLRSKGYDHTQIFKLIEELLLYSSLDTLSDIERYALVVYRDTRLDFEDCILLANNKIKNYQIATFDKDILKFISKSS